MSKHTFRVVKSCFFIVSILPTVVAESLSRKGRTYSHSTILMIPKNAMIFTKMFKSSVMYRYIYLCMQYPLKQNQKVKDVFSSLKRDFIVPGIQVKPRVQGKLELYVHI